MSWLIGVAAVLISFFSALAFHPFENEAINEVCFPALGFVYALMLGIASDIEDKLNRRIKALEKKLEDKEKGGE